MSIYGGGTTKLRGKKTWFVSVLKPWEKAKAKRSPAVDFEDNNDATKPTASRHPTQFRAPHTPSTGLLSVTGVREGNKIDGI